MEDNQHLPFVYPFVYTVAGTNGKGSVASLLDRSLQAHGLKTGMVVSPHFLSFNERACVNSEPTSDEDWLDALKIINHLQQEDSYIPLTYFEYCTLAAFIIFTKAKLDVWILEVGLGGRLDATNVIDTDCAIITSIGLDHTEFLGDTRSEIAREKLGIARADKPLVVGESDPPADFMEMIDKTSAKAYIIGHDFGCLGKDLAGSSEAAGIANGEEKIWANASINNSGKPGEKVVLDLAASVNRGSTQDEDSTKPVAKHHTLLNNYAAAWQALQLYQDANGSALLLDKQKLSDLWQNFQLPGRWQRERFLGMNFIFDCAHNPAAAKVLAQLVVRELEEHRCTNKDQGLEVEAIFAILSTKDWRGVIKPLSPYISKWHLFSMADSSTGLLADKLQKMIQADKELSSIKTQVYSNSAELINSISRHSKSHKKDKRSKKVFLVFGSFYTIEEIYTSLNSVL